MLRWSAIPPALAALAILVSLAPSAAARVASRPADADSLYRLALEQFGSGEPESRRLAVQHLDEATRLDPRRAAIWFALGRACVASGQHERGRNCFERVIRLTPSDPNAHLAAGMEWKWDWLRSLEDSSLARATERLERAATLAPGRAPPWVALAALALMRSDMKTASLAAIRARQADLEGTDPLLALACVAFRAGDFGLADTALKIAIPRLPEPMRRRFDDLALVAGPPDSTRRAAAADAGHGPPSVWSGRDPDLTTPENEAELDYLTRVALALLLFRDEEGLRWDMRSDLLVRYGQPDSIQLHPPQAILEFIYKRHVPNLYAPDELSYPYNEQVWSWADLGMRTMIWDRSLTQTYELPVSLGFDPDPRPDPEAMAGRPDLVTLGQGRGVFRAIPAGMRAIPARAAVARFPSPAGARLVAYLETPGRPADTLRGRWVMVDGGGREVARGTRLLSVSGCEPTRRRAADFAADVPPGDYRLDLSVSDGRGRRGLVRLAARVGPPPQVLALSDVVLLCGEPDAQGTEAVRIEPNLDHRVSGTGALYAYFEIEHLAVNAEGIARFAYTYSVRPRPKKEGRVPPAKAFEATREEQHVGPHRRQYVRVPLQSIPNGAYALDVEVRDLIAGTAASGSLPFLKEEAAAARDSDHP